MGTVLGVSAIGPVGGAFFAATQSALMSGGCGALAALFAPLVWPLIVLFSLTVVTSAIALVAIEWQKAQKHLMGHLNGLVKGMTWVILAHNWAKGVEIRSYASKIAAKKAFSTAGNMRRILLCLSPQKAPLVNNGWGWALPWKEYIHTGFRPDLDNDMRRELLGQLRKAD